MKKIETIIKPFKLDGLKAALDKVGIEAMTVSEVKRFGRRNTHAQVYRGTEFPVDFLPEIKIELVLPDDRVDVAVAAIIKSTKTTSIADNKIFVSPIEGIRNHMEALEEQAV
jgi:nitrogen regulatory protein P-II 1